MKKISVVIPCYNEEKSVLDMYQRLCTVFREKLQTYDYEIIYADDFSTDRTQEYIERLCEKDKRVKAVFNIRNFGFHRNVFECFQYASGDAAFLIFGDLQDPPEMLPAFVEEWEAGHPCVVGQRAASGESKLMQFMRKQYYAVIRLLSDTEQIELMNGFGLYDRRFIDTLSGIEEVSPYFKAVIAEYGINVGIVKYNQSQSRRGKSNFNFLKNYDFAMHGITASTKMLMRMATFLGVLIGLGSVIFSVYVCINKLLNWSHYPLGTASVLVGVFFLGAVQLFFIGILGEYILNINERVNRRPRIVVGKRINFENSLDEKSPGRHKVEKT